MAEKRQMRRIPRDAASAFYHPRSAGPRFGGLARPPPAPSTFPYGRPPRRGGKGARNANPGRAEERAGGVVKARLSPPAPRGPRLFGGFLRRLHQPTANPEVLCD